MELNKLYESIFNEDYKSSYNDYADSYDKYHRQKDYISSKNRNKLFTAEEGPVKLVYSSHYALNDLDEDYEHPADGDLQIFLNGKLVYKIDGGEGGYRDYYGRQSDLSLNVFYLLSSTGEYSNRKPLMQLLKISLGGNGEGIAKLYNALEDTGLPLKELSDYFEKAFNSLRAQLEVQKTKGASIRKSMSNRSNQVDEKYKKYTKEFRKEATANLKPGDVIDLPYYLGGKSTVISVSSTGQTFKVKDSSGKNRVIKASDYSGKDMKPERWHDPEEPKYDI